MGNGGASGAETAVGGIWVWGVGSGWRWLCGLRGVCGGDVVVGGAKGK